MHHLLLALKSLWQKMRDSIAEDFRRPSPPYPLNEEEWEETQKYLLEQRLLAQAKELLKPKK